MSDANLAARRATSVAQQQLQQEREKLRSFRGEGIDLAARSKQLEAKNAKLLAQLASVQLELIRSSRPRVSSTRWRSLAKGASTSRPT